MPSPPDSAIQSLEHPVPVPALPDLSAALANALGESGIGGASIHSLLAEAVEAECVSCGIVVSGEDLTRISPASKEGPRDAKLERLALGYCARKECRSSYYVVRFQPQTGVDWMDIWARAGRSLSKHPEVQPKRASVRHDLGPRFHAFVKWIRHPMLAGLVGLFALGMFVRSGCRVPGLSPKARVFIVGPDASKSVGPTNRGPDRFIAR